MGTMVSVRGWLECDDGQLAQIKEIVEADDPERTYSGAGPSRSAVQRCQVGLLRGYIRAVSLDWFEERMRQIAQIPASYQDDEYDERPRGCFWSATTSTA